MLIRLLTVLAIAGFAAGCTNVARFDYVHSQGSMVKFPDSIVPKKTIAVLPFLDQRGIKYVDPAQKSQAAAHPDGDRGSFYLGLLPLIPAGYVEKAEPENSDDFVSLGRYHFAPATDLQQAATLSLKNSNLFSSVTTANSAQQSEADYIWQGAFTNTYYSGSLLSYCITYFASPVLWIVGAPSGLSHNELGVDFALIDRRSGQVLWQNQFRGSDYVVHWIYARVGQDTCRYPELMKKAMNNALFDLNQKLPELNR